MSFQLFSASAARIPPLWFGHGPRKPPDLTASAFARTDHRRHWSVRTMGIWSEPYENDLRVPTNGDELELGFDDSFGFSAAIGWQPKGFAFGFELEYRSTEHELVRNSLELGADQADATEPSRPFSSTRSPGNSLAWTSPSLAASAWVFSIDFDLRVWGDTDFDVGQFSEDTICLPRLCWI